jgi:phosphatidylserine decarboxylase
LLLPVVLAAGLAYSACGWACASPLIVLAGLIAYLYREPACRVPPSPLAVVSPVHGRVTRAEPGRDPYLQRAAMTVEIRMPLLGPFVLRSPIEGRVMQQWSLPDDGGPVPDDRRGRFAVWLRTDERDDVVLAMRGALITRRLRYPMRVGERVGQGQRCGWVRLAATAEVYLPAHSRIVVASGDALKAGSAIIATLIHKATPPGAEAPDKP